MAVSELHDIEITKGKTFTQVVRWEKEPFIYVPISAIARVAPVAITTAAPHGIPDGWRVAPVSVLGMTQINARHSPPAAHEFKRATVTASDTLTLNKVNAAEFDAYTSGGYLQFYTPASLAGCTARMTIKDAVGGAELLKLTTENARIALDDTAKTITLLVDAITTAAITWPGGVYDLEIQDGSGFVTGLFQGSVTALDEVTT